MARLGIPLRAVLAAGVTNGASPGMVIQPGTDGTSIVDGAPEAASLTLRDPPRAWLTTPTGTRDLLLMPVLDARRAGTGVRRVEVVIDGWRFEVDLEPDSRARLRDRATRSSGDRERGGPVELRAIIPGRVVSVDVADGDEVEAAQRVLVVEAMKMQNELRSPRAGRISRVAVGAGQTVELGDLLLVVE